MASSSHDPIPHAVACVISIAITLSCCISYFNWTLLFDEYFLKVDKPMALKVFSFVYGLIILALFASAGYLGYSGGQGPVPALYASAWFLLILPILLTLIKYIFEQYFGNKQK